MKYNSEFKLHNLQHNNYYCWSENVHFIKSSSLVFLGQNLRNCLCYLSKYIINITFTINLQRQHHTSEYMKIVANSVSCFMFTNPFRLIWILIQNFIGVSNKSFDSIFNCSFIIVSTFFHWFRGSLQNTRHHRFLFDTIRNQNIKMCSAFDCG